MSMVAFCKSPACTTQRQFQTLMRNNSSQPPTKAVRYSGVVYEAYPLHIKLANLDRCTKRTAATWAVRRTHSYSDGDQLPPAWWAVGHRDGQPGMWPQDGEIDILEYHEGDLFYGSRIFRIN